ncbi:hypothetical protein PTKIN_Ptkin07bG0061500 [Pterospermum kingtungense]
MERVIFESDAKLVGDALHSSKTNILEFGFIITTCKACLLQDGFFKVCYVKRQANKVAHALAKASCSQASPLVWFSPPCFLDVLLSEDLYSLSNES